jgi:predicted HAD superfamily hydrolase
MILDTIQVKKINTLLSKHKINIIMSDIFDTLLCRRVHPEHIKKIIAFHLNKIFPEITATKFYKVRQFAELECYKKSNVLYGDSEIIYPLLISRIYEILTNAYPGKIFLKKNDFYLLHQALELTTECKNQVPDENMLNLLRQHKQRGKKIILLSDFYMSATLIQFMFKYHKINDIYDHLVTSADYMKTKRSGKLYEAIISNGILPKDEKALMIGDNYYSDIFSAKQYGFETYHIIRNKQKKYYAEQQKKASSKVDFYTNLNKCLTASSVENIFSHIPLVLFLSITKLYRLCLKNNIKKLYFLSREGKIIKDMFDEYQTHIKSISTGSPIISTYYLLASRRSTAAASLGPIQQEKFETLFRQYQNISIKQFVLSYAFDIEKISKICQSININIEKVHSHIASADDFKRLCSNAAFIKYYDYHRKSQKNYFLSYLKTLMFSSENNEPLYLFDVGWKGSIQDNIQKALDHKPVLGFYIGLIAPGALSKDNDKKGLLFDFRHKNKDFWIYKENISLFEILLTANHGSVKKYTSKQTGGVIPVFENNTLEKNLYKEKIQSLQENIYKKFKETLKLLDLYELNIDTLEKHIIKSHKRKIFSPSKREMSWFENMQHFENFGIFTYSNFISAQRISIKIRLSNFFIFLKSPKKYIQSSFWPSLKFYQDGLRFLILPYKWYLLNFIRLKQK